MWLNDVDAELRTRACLGVNNRFFGAASGNDAETHMRNLIGHRNVWIILAALAVAFAGQALIAHTAGQGLAQAAGETEPGSSVKAAKGSVGGVGVGLLKLPTSNGNIGIGLVKLPK